MLGALLRGHGDGNLPELEALIAAGTSCRVRHRTPGLTWALASQRGVRRAGEDRRARGQVGVWMGVLRGGEVHHG